jgi:signal transduction histidine kinase
MHSTYSPEVNVKKKAIIYGVILGVISLVLSIISLYFSKTATSIVFSSVINILISYVLFLAAAVFFTLQLRKAVGGYWDFSTALKNIFIMLAITTVVGTIGINLFNVAYPNLQFEAIENTQNLTIEMMESNNIPDEQIDTTLEMLDQQKEALGSLSIGQILKGMAISILLYFILALIFAAIFKRERPMFRKAGSEEAHPWQDNANNANPGLEDQNRNINNPDNNA